MIPGTRYTKLGIVCIVSNTGRIPVSTESLLAAKIPTGTPITIDKKTATIIIATVTIVGSHKLTIARTISPTSDIIAIFNEATFHPIIKTRAIIIGHGIQINRSLSFPNTTLIASLTASKKSPNVITIQSIESSRAPSTSLLTLSGKSRANSTPDPCIINDKMIEPNITTVGK